MATVFELKSSCLYIDGSLAFEGWSSSAQADNFFKSIWQGKPVVPAELELALLASDVPTVPEFEKVADGSLVLSQNQPWLTYELSADIEVRRTQTPLLLLSYVLNKGLFIYVEDDWRIRHAEVKLPSNVRMQFAPDALIRGTLPERHHHDLPIRNISCELLGRYFMFNDVADANGVRMALHPYFTLAPDELLAILQSADSPIQLVRSFLQDVLTNFTNTTIKWHPLNAAYITMAEGVKPTRGITKPWVNFSLSRDMSCPLCGMRLEISTTKLSAEGVLDVFINSNYYAIDRQSPDLPRCDVTQHLAHMSQSTVTFPSGKVLYADWLRCAEFTERTKDEEDYSSFSSYSINYVMGKIQKSLRLAANDIVHGSTGNESVVLYKVPGGVLIADYVWDREEISEEDFEGYPDHVEELGSICTDLWAYTLMDEARLESFIEGPSPFNPKKAESSAGGDAPGYFEIDPGQYCHQYLSCLPFDTALEALPEHVVKLIRKMGITRVHGFLHKVDSL